MFKKKTILKCLFLYLNNLLVYYVDFFSVVKFNVNKSIGTNYHSKRHCLIQEAELLVGKKAVDEYIEEYSQQREFQLLCVLDTNQED